MSQFLTPAEAAPAEFQALLRWFRQRSGLSQNRLARLAGIDPAYVNRIESSAGAESVVPRLRILDALAGALELSPAERDRFYFAAGRLPPSLAELGHWDPALATLVELLATPDLAADDLAEFRAVLTILADRWRRGASMLPG
jgi:transcriptional regulator with XRE-family HTH domain